MSHILLGFFGIFAKVAVTFRKKTTVPYCVQSLAHNKRLCPTPVMYYTGGDCSTQHTNTHVKCVVHARVLRACHLELGGAVVLQAIIDEDVPTLSLEHLVIGTDGRVGVRGWDRGRGRGRGSGSGSGSGSG